jgi:xanthine dehydrogenase accessory factor
VSNWYDRVHELTNERIPLATVTIVRGAGLGGKVIVTGDSAEGSLGDAALDASVQAAARDALERGKSGIVAVADGVDAFVEVIPVPPQLVIFGAVHVAQALIPIAKSVGFDVVVVDARQQLATPERFPEVEQVMVAWPDEALGQLKITNTTAIAILTHDPKFDEPAILGSLATKAMYIGAVGSRKTNADRQQRLRDSGVSEDQIARVHGPIGLDIGGRSPEEMAISIIAEIIAVRNGRTGQALRETSGDIRAE